jgi:hypothetical protein
MMHPSILLSYGFCLYGEKGYMQEGCSVNGQIYVMVGRNSITVFSNQWPTGPLSGRLSEGFQDIFMAEATTRHLIHQELLLHRESTMDTGQIILFFHFKRDTVTRFFGSFQIFSKIR